MNRSYFLVSLTVAAACSQPAPRPAAEAILDGHLPELQVAIFPDQSRSIERARILPLTTSDLTPIFERLQASGGELAVGTIREDSNMPLIRLRIPAPPTPPRRQLRPTGLFAAAAAQRAADGEQAIYQSRLRSTQAGARAAIEDFKKEITPVLARPFDAPATDISSAMDRASLFLSEPSIDRDQRKIVIVISDGIETLRKSPLPAFKNGVDVLLVNGTGSVAALAPLHPVRFESPAAAIRYAAAQGGSDVRAR